MTERQKGILKFMGEHPGYKQREVAEALGFSRHAVRRAIKAGKYEEGLQMNGDTNKEETASIEISDSTTIVTTRSANIKTLEAALAYAKVDLNVWEVDHHIINFWEVTMGKRSTDTGSPETYTNFQVKVWLRRKIAKPVQDYLNDLITKVGEHVPIYLKKSYPIIDGEGFMLEVSLFDHHMGMMSWGEETSENYDLKIAKDLYRQAVTDLLGYAKPFPIEKILFPIGQDFLHINDTTNLTPKGKAQLDVDGRFAKVIESGYETLVTSIDTCLAVAPVKLVWIPGNHDPETSYYVARLLQEHYRGASDVEVDVRPKRRKSVVYGPTLLCFAHGQEESGRDLPMVIASEERVDFGKCKHFEIHVGHLHKSRETRLVTADTMDGGVVVRILPSLSAADSWHYAHGWSVRPRAAEAYLWSNQRGYSGHFSVNARNIKVDE